MHVDVLRSPHSHGEQENCVLHAPPEGTGERSVTPWCVPACHCARRAVCDSHDD